MILSVQNISKSFVDSTILNRCSFHIEDNEKAAIVGINGAGKTTLLRIIVGELSPDEGVVSLTKDKTIGYLSQQPSYTSGNTIYQELLSVKKYLIDMEEKIRSLEQDMKSAKEDELKPLMDLYSSLNAQYEQENGYAFKSELYGVLKGLGFTENEFDKKIDTLSGGQKTRVNLGKILIQKPDLIILDEPTNHLDMHSISWLETYLMNYKGAVLVVSHDRYFLNRIAGKIIEIDLGKATSFTGNYSDYAAKKEILRAAKWNAYQNNQREIKHQEAVIEKLKSFNREKSIKRAESREKALAKMETIEKPMEAKTDIKMHLVPRLLSGNDVLTVTSLSKSFGPQNLFQDLNFSCKRGEHVSIIGDNGTGKTTILKIINGLEPADTGEVKTGSNVQIGYYDQEHHVLHENKTLFDEISDDYPTLTNTEIRNTLAAFLFTGDDVFKLVADLSGGERGRLSLAKLMLSEANFIILDEPTNHLDIQSKEILEDALNSYEGTVLYVSHDRYFINRTAHRILDLSGRKLTEYLGNFDYYLEKKAQLSGEDALGKPAGSHTTISSYASSDTSPASDPDSESKMDWKAQKEQQARKRKLENDLKKTEQQIAVLEEKNQQINLEMAKPEVATNVGRLTELSKEHEANSKELERLYEKWEELTEICEE